MHYLLMNDGVPYLLCSARTGQSNSAACRTPEGCLRIVP